MYFEIWEKSLIKNITPRDAFLINIKIYPKYLVFYLEFDKIYRLMNTFHISFNATFLCFSPLKFTYLQSSVRKKNKNKNYSLHNYSANYMSEIELNL